MDRDVLSELRDARTIINDGCNERGTLLSGERCKACVRYIDHAIILLKEYEQSEQSYLRTLVELSNERDKLLKELGREDEHKYKDGSFMAGGNGIVKL